MKPPRRILVACDKFKGSLDASEACAAVARGLRRRWPAAVIDECPIADGGEGFAMALGRALGGHRVEVPVHDALGRPVTAGMMLADFGGQAVAVIEMAEASGLWRIEEGERDPLRSSTFGTGEMMRHAVERLRVGRLVVGIGGSATNDGGAGMAAALGVRCLDAAGRELQPWPGAWLDRLAVVDTRGRIPLPPVTVACDVASPLLGGAGATRVFGPQKGAGEAEMVLLERALVQLVDASGGEREAAVPGAGAAGGLGFGLLRFTAAELVPGFGLLSSLAGLAERVAAADLVVTGEGSLDAQTLAGKGPAGVARLACDHGKPVWAFCGRADVAARDSGCFAAVRELAASGLSTAELMRRAAELLEDMAAVGARRVVHEDGIEPPTDRV